MTSSVWVRIRILSREVGYLFLVSVTLKSTRQPINTITFYLRDISTPLVGVAFKHIDQNVRTVNIQMLVDVISALQWLLWLGSALSRSLMFLSKGVHVFVLTKLPSSRFIFNLLLLHFDLIISSDSLIFLLLCLASVDNTFGCSQLNWPWHSKQCSVAPELSHFPFMLSWWCSIVMVNTFFFVSPMYSAFEWTRRKVSRFDNSRWICKQATIKLSPG